MVSRIVSRDLEEECQFLLGVLIILYEKDFSFVRDCKGYKQKDEKKKSVPENEIFLIKMRFFQIAIKNHLMISIIHSALISLVDIR